VRHNFETAHRLPHLGGKCVSLHGHSWWAEVTVSALHLSPSGTVVEFGAFKAAMRGWIDTHLDHGAMLGATDPLAPFLRELGSKVFMFGQDGLGGGCSWLGADWPTVEAVAALIAEKARCHWVPVAALVDDAAQGAEVTHVRVHETGVNTADWVIKR
jgi:6-pyruvoyltetrahydropterin/6-carboxytetrahydropterin synthase